MIDWRAVRRLDVLSPGEIERLQEAHYVDPQGRVHWFEDRLDWVGRLALTKLKDWLRHRDRCGK